MATLTKEQMEFLQSMDTPTVCNVVEMVAPVERADRHDLKQHAQEQRSAERKHGARYEAACPRHECRREVGTQHVQRTVGEVHHVHDPENQRQTGRQQE